MPKHPVVSGRELIRAVKHIGWETLRQRGSHVTLVNWDTGKTVPVPVHGSRPLPSGTLAEILRQMDISYDELRELLGK